MKRFSRYPCQNSPKVIPWNSSHLLTGGCYKGIKPFWWKRIPAYGQDASHLLNVCLCNKRRLPRVQMPNKPVTGDLQKKWAPCRQIKKTIQSLSSVPRCPIQKNRSRRQRGGFFFVQVSNALIVCDPKFIGERLLESRHRVLPYKNCIERPCLKQCFPSSHESFHILMRILKDVGELIDRHDDLVASLLETTYYVPDGLKGSCVNVRPTWPIFRNFGIGVL
ncbi:MAG: hypothetical protein A4E65_00046 [Syntrophorhabdus sp. PtaU1.Bin153]|nr:MAG: hypothetical protein A4E65_00046 [Syntrophorhabdus sp. PtaU1.Bin153]